MLEKIFPFLLLLNLICICGCAEKQVNTVQVTEPVSIEIPNYYPNIVEVRDAIFAASHSLKWRAQDRSPGVLLVICKLKGRESITFEVDYSNREYAISYKDSTRKAYNAESGKVHPYFEVLAKELHAAIATQLEKAPNPVPNINVKPAISLEFNNQMEIDEKTRKESMKLAEKEEQENNARLERINKLVQQESDSHKASVLIGSQSSDVAQDKKTPDTPKSDEQNLPQAKESDKTDVKEIDENTEKPVERSKIQVKDLTPASKQEAEPKNIPNNKENAI